MRGRLALAVAAALALGVVGTLAGPRPRPCPEGRFIVPVAAGALTTGAARSVPDVVALAGAHVSLASGCPAASARIRARRRFTKITATWVACDGVPGKVQLRGRIDAATCAILTGAIKVRSIQATRRFAAERSRCGDGLIDAGNREECEPPGTTECNGGCLMAARCGNRVVEGFEACDDGNRRDCDECRGDCTRPDAICGDGIIECGEDCEGNADPCEDDEICDEDCDCVPPDD